MSATRSNQRRRRVILEEAVQSDPADLQSDIEGASSRSKEKLPAYSDSAKRRGQLKTTDLIPKRSLPLAFMIVAVLSFFGLLNLFAFQFGGMGDTATGPFRLRGVGTLSSWFSSMLFMVSGMASLQIYGMRRHRCDDYSGHYRIWLFLAVIFVAVSVNCVVDLQHSGKLLAQSLGFSGGNSLVVFLVIKIVALTAIVIRGILEIRASRGALVTVLIVWMAYASAVVCQIPAVNDQLVQRDEFVLGNLTLVGHVAIFLTATIYARFIYLQANGLILLPIESAKAKSLSESSTEKLVEHKDEDAKRRGRGQSSVSDQDVVETPEDSETPILKMGTVDSSNKSKSSKKQSSKKSRRRAA